MEAQIIMIQKPSKSAELEELYSLLLIVSKLFKKLKDLRNNGEPNVDSQSSIWFP
jgi:hypothetical protein